MKKTPDPKGERGISWGDPSISAREYRRNPHSVTLINYHFVFCPKRRKKVLTGKIAHRLQEVIFELCTENNWRLIALEIMPDHVHLFLNADPSFAPSVIIKRIKGRASHHLRKEFPELLKLPTLWTPSYFVATTGNASTETIKRYIESQKGK
ncbi:MAG: IS200/IS605 family transposase [Xenococcus sp. MO_188.B8]|nr:IS200/IS605 family transposase [Xenococcus sp. MO_188.B8]